MDVFHTQDATSDARRIQTRDCLYALYLDLRAQARGLRPWDADAREAWLAACAQLLAQVPDRAQRAGWAYWLAADLWGQAGAVLCVTAGHLLARAAR